MKALRVLSKQLGQSAPVPHRGLQPLSGSADGSGGHSIERDYLGKGKQDVLNGRFDDTEGAGLPQAGQVDLSSWGNGSSLDDEGFANEGRKKKGKRKKHQDAEASSKGDKFPEAPGGLTPITSSLDSPRAKGRGQGLDRIGSQDRMGGGMGGGMDLGGMGGGMDSPGGKGSSLLDLKKPSMSAVDEVRHAIGMPGGATRLPAMGTLGQSNNLFGSERRLPSPGPAPDGLSTVGRAKVRAGIRLQPIGPA